MSRLLTARWVRPSAGKTGLFASFDWVLLLPLVAFLLRLGAAPLFDVDEGAFSEATREMLHSGDWLSTTLNGAPRYDKPILIYWLQAMSVSLFGLSEYALRLPSALSACGWCYAVYAFARPRLGLAAARLALVVTATALGVFAIGRAATADGLLNLLLTLACLDVYRALEADSNDMPFAHARKASRRAWLWMGLGLLAKGPIAVLVPGVVALLLAATHRRWVALGRALADPAGWALLLIVAVPWYAAAWHLHGMEFVEGFLLKHNVRRFTGVVSGHQGGMLYYLIALPALLLPWSGALLAAAVNALRRFGEVRRDPLQSFLWLWFAFVFIFFSFSGTKLPHYVLYGSTPLFLLIGRYLSRLPLRAEKLGEHLLSLLLLLPGVAVLALFCAIPQIVNSMLPKLAMNQPYYAAQLAGITQLADTGYFVMVGIAALAAIGILLVCVVARRIAVAGALPFIATAQLLALALAVLPLLGNLLQGPVRAAGLALRALPGPTVQWDTNMPSFSVYTERETLYRAPEIGEIALLRIDRLPPAYTQAVETGQYQEIFRAGGVIVIRRIK